MFLASKAAWAGIVLIVVTTGISGPRPAPLASGASLSKEAPGVVHRDDLEKMHKLCGAKDTTVGRSMASSVSERKLVFARIRTLRICQSLGSLIPRQPPNSESGQSAGRKLATRLRKTNLRHS
jgi:hypothetical protein